MIQIMKQFNSGTNIIKKKVLLIKLFPKTEYLITRIINNIHLVLSNKRVFSHPNKQKCASNVLEPCLVKCYYTLTC